MTRRGYRLDLLLRGEVERSAVFQTMVDAMAHGEAWCAGDPARSAKVVALRTGAAWTLNHPPAGFSSWRSGRWVPAPTDERRM